MKRMRLFVLLAGLAFAGAGMHSAWSATSEANKPDAADGASASASTSSSTSASNNTSSGSSATFRGRNASISVDGDLVQARDGVLSVNGVPYGRVDQNAVVNYSVKNGEKRLTVDNVERKPLR